MNTKTMPNNDFLNAILAEISLDFAERAQMRDGSDAFVQDNYRDLKRHKVFSAMIPAALGGGGVSYSDMSAFIVGIAHSCPSTALALSMHQHVVATNIINHRAGRLGEALLNKVAASEAVLVSTGAKDWLKSNGEAVKVQGGYQVTGTKHFSSGAPAGEILVTSAISQGDAGSPEVLHFAIPMDTKGVSLNDNWQAMGMRSTGSQSISLEQVFVPDASVTLRRPSGRFHPLYAVVLGVGLPLIMSVYVGIAEKAAELAINGARNGSKDTITTIMSGEMETSLTTAKLAHDHMISLVNDLSFEPTIEIASQMLTRKTIISTNVLATCRKAIEISGGAGYLRSGQLEQLLRDAYASQFHPLPEKYQQVFSGRFLLGLDPD